VLIDELIDAEGHHLRTLVLMRSGQQLSKGER
jgi:hypothetical protein